MQTPDRLRPELLAPAGGPDALRAAVANGADAVYLGLDTLNARRGAQNFTVETLEAACEFAHVRGVRVYLTANVLVLPEEMSGALELIDAAWACGVDGVIVQDLGLMRCLRRALPDVVIHASTQVNIHATSTLSVLAQMGVRRVTLARETSIEEVARLASAGRQLGVDVETFVHGALCVCYSGQCLLSSMIGGRSANRGTCAQPCRLPYALEGSNGASLEADGAYLLSPKDLAGIALLPDLIAAGVASLKIEGRMKSAEYVAVVTGVYRDALARAVDSPETYAVRDGEWEVLADAFSRGFTTGYLTGERGSGLMSHRRPNNRGVSVGRLASADGGAATLAPERTLSSDDVIEVWTRRGRFAQPVGPIESRGRRVAIAPAGEPVRITLSQPASAGDRVFRVRNAALLEAAARTFSEPESAPVPVDVTVRVVVGEPLSVTVTSASGVSGQASGPVVETARTRAVTAEDVAEHVGRFGGSGFSPREWDISLSPGAGIGFSALHAVRREALAALRQRMLAAWADRRRFHPAEPGLQRRAARHASGDARLVAVVGSVGAARACVDTGAREAQVAWSMPGTSEVTDAVVILPRICHDDEETEVLDAAPLGRGAVAGTLGLLARAVEAGVDVQAHWSLNATNAHTVAALADLGASLVWLSPELSGDQLAAIAASSPVPVGIAVAGRQELMVLEHCVLSTTGPCKADCRRCARRQGRHVLKDRKGYRFPVVVDEQGRTHVYNAVPLDLTEASPDIVASGVSWLRLDLETERAPRAAAEVRRVRAALERGVRGAPIPPRNRATTTTGHFYRGVS